MPPRPTSPSPRLTRDVILDAYVRLADREGPEAVSLRRLGAELGVDATAVYRHFRDKDALLEAVADRLLFELGERHVRDADWRADLRNLALEGRRMYLGHPRLARIVAASPEPLPSNARLAEIVLDDLRLGGIVDADAALAYEAFSTYVAGSSALDADIGADVSAAWRRRLAALDPEQYPNTTAVAAELYPDEDAAFVFGLDLMLDALAARAHGPSAGVRRGSHGT
jgi:TetR/AcrR family tetracycline transcriptional repressor